MKRIFSACLFLFTVFTALAASPEETMFLQLTDEFDTAVATADYAKLKSLLHPGYIYAEPEPNRPMPDDATLPDRIDYRLFRDKCWSDGPLTVRVVEDRKSVV